MKFGKEVAGAGGAAAGVEGVERGSVSSVVQ